MLRGQRRSRGGAGKGGTGIMKVGKGVEGGEGEPRGACRRSRKSETPRMLRARYCRRTGATTGRDGISANRIIVVFCHSSSNSTKTGPEATGPILSLLPSIQGIHTL